MNTFLKRLGWSVVIAAMFLFIAYVSLAAAAVNSEQFIRERFGVYGYMPNEQDIAYWEITYKNQYGTLEQNLQRRFSQNTYVETLPTVSDEAVFGGVAPFRPSEFKTTLAEQKTEGHSNTTLKVTSITTKDGNTLDGTTLGDFIVLSINPNGSNSEIVACTGLTTATKTFTGCTFGYRFDTNSSSSSNVKAHAPGESVIISNSDTYLVNQFPSLDGANVYYGEQTYATTTASAKIKHYFGTQFGGTYFWYDSATGNLGYATSTSGELTWNTDGTSFTPIAPITLTSGELKLATSTYDFRLDDANTIRVASSTVAGGTASGNMFDDGWNERWNSTTTKPLLTTFSDGLTSSATTTVATNLIADGVVRSYTAGQALAAGRAVYLAPTTTRVFYVNDTDATSTVNMIGINLWDVVEDATTYVLTSGVYETSGLTGGSLYYVNSNGQFTAATSTATSIESIIGRAVNTTDLQLSHGRDMQFLLERADTTDVIEVPQLARHATLVISATNSSAAANITGWELNLSKIGKTLATVTHANSTGDSCTATAAWDVTTNAINLSYTGTNCTAVAGTAYFYY